MSFTAQVKLDHKTPADAGQVALYFGPVLVDEGTAAEVEQGDTVTLTVDPTGKARAWGAADIDSDA